MSFRTKTTPKSLKRRPLSAEHPFALQVDHLPGFAKRESHRVFVRGEGVGADKAVLLPHAADVPLDRPGCLILPFVLERRGADDEAFVFDGLGEFFRLPPRDGRRRRTERSETTLA